MKKNDHLKIRCVGNRWKYNIKYDLRWKINKKYVVAQPSEPMSFFQICSIPASNDPRRYPSHFHLQKMC